MKPFLILGIPLLVVIAVVASVLWQRNHRQIRAVSIVIGGDTAGWITPCGCAANQAGGLARRATLLGSQRSESEVVFLDAGGSASGTSDYHQLKLRHILSGLSAMGLDAHNLGGPECKLSPDALRTLSADSKVTWVSSNVTAKDGKFLAAPILLIERSRSKIAIAGVSDPNLPHHDGLTIADPKQSILHAMKDVQADVRVVLAYLNEPGLRQLSSSLPEIDYVIGGPTGQVIPASKVGSGYVLSATNKGKFLASVHIPSKSDHRGLDLGSPAFRVFEVASTHDENRTQLANLELFYAELAKRDFRSDEAGIDTKLQTVASRNDAHIAGSESCRKCHVADCDHWETTKHATAWMTLNNKHAQYDSYCQQCHTTGYGLSGGFVNVAQSVNRVNVGCENCHGPSKAHVEKPTTRTPYLATQQCLRCHDHENSPNFQYDSYWPKVRHGQKTH